MKTQLIGPAALGALCLLLSSACDHDGSANATPAASSAAPSASASAKPAVEPSAKPESATDAKPDSGHAPRPAAFEAFHGRGVFYTEAKVGCPHVGVGTRDDHACLRIGLDDEHSSADVDRPHHRIVLRNDGTYKGEQIVADVILPGWSDSPKERAPISVHCVVRKKGTTFSTKVYAHAVTREKPTKVEVEDLEIVLHDDKADTVLVNAEIAHKAVADPGIAARLAGFLTEVTDNNEPGTAAAAGEPRAAGDITISIGLGPAAKKALRAQLFRTGADTEVRLTALSSLIPEYIVQRDLFLYGLEPATNLGEVKKRGFKAGDTMVMRVHDGKGSIRFGATSSDLPDAANSMHDFLTTAFVGMVLAHQAKLDAK